MKILSLIRKFVLLVVSSCFIFFITFYFWGSSAALKEADLETIRKNENPHQIETAQFDSTIQVVTYNIGYLSGLTNNLPIDRSRDFVAENLRTVMTAFRNNQVDIIAFQEIDYEADRSFGLNQAEELARMCDYDFVANSVNWNKKYVPFPYFPVSSHFGKTVSGQSVLSRLPIIAQEKIVLPIVESAPFYYQKFYLDRLLQICTLQIQKREVIVMNLHLEAFDSPTRQRQAEIVGEYYRKYVERYPVILLGDFNSQAPNEAYRKSERYEKTMDKFLELPHIQSVVPSSEFGKKEWNTYPSDAPDQHIDYIFYNRNFLECTKYRIFAEAAQASDHLPLWAELRLIK